MSGIKLKTVKNKTTLKLLVSVLLSNLFLYMMMGNSNKERILHQGYTLVKLPLETFVPLDGTPEISLYSPTKKKIIAKAHLHNLITKGDPMEEKYPTYEVEVDNRDLLKLISLKSKYLLAYPANHHKKEVSNEVIF